MWKYFGKYYANNVLIEKIYDFGGKKQTAVF
jgi:hypothetical protein